MGKIFNQQKFRSLMTSGGNCGTSFLDHGTEVRLTFFLRANDRFLNSWKCSVSGTINGERFNTEDEMIEQKEMILEHCCEVSDSSLKLQLEMKISENGLVKQQKFVDTTRQCKQIISHNKSLLNGAKYSDFTFIVKGKVFKVHKNILAGSPVFDKMFQSKMSETVSSECRVTDIEPQIFQFLLDVIYAGQLPQQLHEDTLARELFKVAHLYQINELVHICASVEHYKLTKDNAVDMFKWADTYGLENIKTDAWKMIQFGILGIFEEKPPPSIHVLNELIAAREEKQKLLLEIQIEIGKLEAKTKDLLK